MDAADDLTEYEEIRYKMRAAWFAAYGSEPAGWRAGEEVDPGDAPKKVAKWFAGDSPFDTACYRLHRWIESFQRPYGVEDIAIATHGNKWLAKRAGWPNPPGKLADVRQLRDRARKIFWVVDRATARAEGDLGDL